MAISSSRMLRKENRKYRDVREHSIENLSFRIIKTTNQVEKQVHGLTR